MSRSTWPFIVVGALLGIAAVGVIRARHTESAELPSPAPAQRSPRPAGRPAGPAVQGFALNQGQVSQRELAPTDPRYNPIALANEDDLTPKEVFDAEPRDSTFAPVLEQRIQAGYAEAFKELRLDQKVLAVSAQCKTLSCYTYVEVAKDDGLYVYKRINGLIMGDRHSPGLVDGESPDTARITFHTLYEPRMRDEAWFRKFMAEAFSQMIESMKMIYPLE